jgi:hypothetical protein
MDKHTQASKEYLDTLLKYFEDEISGESYFYGLAEHFAEREKTILLARAERRAAAAVYEGHRFAVNWARKLRKSPIAGKLPSCHQSS